MAWALQLELRYAAKCKRGGHSKTATGHAPLVGQRAGDSGSHATVMDDYAGISGCTHLGDDEVWSRAAKHIRQKVTDVGGECRRVPIRKEDRQRTEQREKRLTRAKKEEKRKKKRRQREEMGGSKSVYG